MTPSPSRSLVVRGRPGFTMIEILVVLGIIALLIGLLLPAVQAAREAARRASFLRNLKEIATALHSFEASRGGFPPRVLTFQFPSTTDPARYGSFSTQVALLPYLEQGPLFNQLNLDSKLVQVEDLGGVNLTAARVAIGVFLCPSDPAGRGDLRPGNSYRGNLGNDPFRTGPTGAVDLVEDGAFVTMRPVLPLSEFRDGLAQTLSFAEKPIGSGIGGTYSSFRDWVALTTNARTGREFVTVCSRLQTSDGAVLDAGATWCIAGATFTHFFTSAPPNSLTIDCGGMTNLGSGVFAARSYHLGGVNAALGDGSARWFSATIDPDLWRALGTRAGGEATP